MSSESSQSSDGGDGSGILPSWRDGTARQAVVDFVDAVTTGPDAVPPEELVAVFDNDGTLWTEKPMPTQLHYIVEQWVAAAKADPSLAENQPYLAATTGDFAWLGGAIDKHYAGDDSDLKTMIAAIVGVTANLSVEQYAASVTAFYRDARHLTLGRPYSQAIYQPMVELLRFLEKHGFTCYIVSGGERDFMRPMTIANYGIPPERVVGSAFGLEYDADAREVRYGKSLAWFDDGPEKPGRIWNRIGRRPILAGGNSNGDIAMLDYVRSHPRSLSLLVHHDDDTDRGDHPYDKGAEQALERAAAGDFQIVSVKADWATVFPE